MAIILGSKPTIDLKENSQIAIGITLPIQKGNSGYFEQSYQTTDQIKSNIRNLMLTIPGERLMQPSFGTDLHKLLFNQNTETLAVDIENAIISALKFWLPFVEVQTVDIIKDNAKIDRHEFEVTVTYKTPPLQKFETVTFNIVE